MIVCQHAHSAYSLVCSRFLNFIASFLPTRTSSQVRPSHAGPTMQTEKEAAMLYKSNDIMFGKRAKHAHIIEKERQKRKLADAAAADAAGSNADIQQQQQQQQRKKRKGQDGEAVAAAEEGSASDDEGGWELESSGGGEDAEIDGGGGDSGSGDESMSDDGDEEQQQQRVSGSKRKRGQQFVLPVLVDGPLSEGRYKDEGFFVSHTRWVTWFILPHRFRPGCCSAWPACLAYWLLGM